MVAAFTSQTLKQRNPASDLPFFNFLTTNKSFSTRRMNNHSKYVWAAEYKSPHSQPEFVALFSICHFLPSFVTF